MTIRRTFFIALISLMLLLAGCQKQVALVDEESQKTEVAGLVSELQTQEWGKKEIPATKTPSPEPSSTPTVTKIPDTPTATMTPTEVSYRVGPSDFPDDVNPLTGLKVDNPEIMNRLPLMVKVPNFPAYGRPHGGLSAADIVFETWIGAGANRFVPIYYGQDCDYVWPIRSVRIVDPELATLYHAILVFSGGDPVKVLPKVNDIMDNKYVMEGTTPGMYSNGADVTRLHVDTKVVTEDLQKRGIDPGEKPELEGMLFDEKIPEGGEDGEELTFHFSKINSGDWVYDEESGKYMRWIEDAASYEMIPLIDKNTGEQLAFSNVIVLFTPNNEIETQLIDIKIWDNPQGRRAILFRDGKAYEGIWKTTDRNAPMQFFDEDGNLFPLKPGNTWIAITGTTSPVEVEDGEWFVQFRVQLP